MTTTITVPSGQSLSANIAIVQPSNIRTYIPQGANSRYPKPTTGRIGSGWLGHQPYCIYFGYLTCDVEQRANIWTRVTFLPSFFALFFGSLYTTYQLLVDGV
ncbi:hypothetical protein K438DRAFT_1774592 [Mycena galopus ATCC 62051]|nr:hypothetical protein K438DRAFT_1774592 [Mycena galopus ATCC 62051]